MSLRHRLLFAALCALTLPACRSVPEGWQEALRQPAPARATDPAGAWRGTWLSEVNGHTGELLCAVSPASAAELGMHTFRYHATWGRILSAPFTVGCTVDRNGKITGSKDLGPLFGGTFSHEGALRGDTFHARYQSSLDRGTMEMRRVRE